MANGNGNLMDDFEEAFQHCLHVLTKQDPSDDDVIKLEVEQTTMNFINLARQIDVFFLQKRFLLCTLKPELLLNEENHDLKLELARKGELIRKHSEKLESWKKLLSEQPKTMPTAAPVPPGGNMMNPGVVGMPPQQMNPNMVGPGMQVIRSLNILMISPDSNAHILTRGSLSESHADAAPDADAATTGNQPLIPLPLPETFSCIFCSVSAHYDFVAVRSAQCPSTSSGGRWRWPES